MFGTSGVGGPSPRSDHFWYLQKFGFPHEEEEEEKKHELQFSSVLKELSFKLQQPPQRENVYSSAPSCA